MKPVGDFLWLMSVL